MKPVYIVGSVLITFLIVGGWFYWFQYRPAEISKECAEHSQVKLGEEQSRGTFRTGQYTAERDDIFKMDAYYDLTYKICLEEKGLK